LSLASSASQSDIPSSPEDFERRLLAEPNNSLLWIQYVAYCVSVVEIETARSVIEKAIKVISFRQEEEKYNMWVTYLNLEYKYGTSVTLEAVFKRSVQHSKVRRIVFYCISCY
jgi:rRNA biogenesis protein RRP5